MTASTSSGAKSPNENNKYCEIIADFMESYLVDSSAPEEMFYEGSPAEPEGPSSQSSDSGESTSKIPTIYHINVHREQYNLLKDCKTFLAILHDIKLKHIAKKLLLKVSIQYYLIFQSNLPVEFKCLEEHCKKFETNLKNIVQVMKETGSDYE